MTEKKHIKLSPADVEGYKALYEAVKRVREESVTITLTFPSKGEAQVVRDALDSVYAQTEGVEEQMILGDAADQMDEQISEEA